jgi:2-amino-4-hydroxy-6-hydroxymethyldihydropteridine diphosphokinase
VTPTVTAYIALGANLGDREWNIRSAIALLNQTPGVRVTNVTGLMENPAVGGPPQSPPFLNAAAELQTTLSASDIMNRLLEIETELGRVRRERWGPRSIDLDLLLYGDQIIDTPGLTIPHPRMADREFVLAPLAEIAPTVVHPIEHLTAGQLLEKLRKRRV